MAKKKTRLQRFSDLTWDDLEEWAGGKILSRGKSYQRQGRVSNLAITDDGCLIAWVDGTEHYATRVVMDEENLPESICTCPYAMDCKHGVAVVIDYLEQVKNKRAVPGAENDDPRLKHLEEECLDMVLPDEPDDSFEESILEMDRFLRSKTKAQLINLIHELGDQYPDIVFDLADRRLMVSGDAKAMVTRLRHEIQDMADEPGWQNYWEGHGYTPDYSGINKKLEALLDKGHADEVVALGKELVDTGLRLVGESHDEGETAYEVAACLPVILKALDRSSLETVDRLNWAVDAVLADQYDVCSAFAEYLFQQHPKTAWHSLANRLQFRLKKRKQIANRDYERDWLSNWVIHALEQSGRNDEIIPLCEAEAERTGSYVRLVDRLIKGHRHQDAEQWIKQGIKDVGDKWAGIAAQLRERLLEIRKKEKNQQAVAAIQVEEFVRYPNLKTYKTCGKAAKKIKAWPEVREFLLDFLEAGNLPWGHEKWNLPKTGLDAPKPRKRDLFPMLEKLIDIAILEKKPDQVLRWYDQLPKNRFSRPWVDENDVALAVETYAPDRAVEMWKRKAEGLIALVKPKAYQEAAVYLKKAGKLMVREKKSSEWKRYLQNLKQEQKRKRRLVEILDGLLGKPIIS